ncbi:CheR family methyltransferase [Pontixanthobacter aestiaquae]|uniref:Methyltransferase domain-containing protein n=1 Tax=Pontixanthobacter aestiaquae TaxID=1509367 RepID=A0A844Z6V1_9SPHN|nr:CheR family methyltransferase [Pontixanthobacter aestiaquae]MDN3646211.1 CheR family methyltransferase [Pontixanthobacter aestiaquae]MXO82797.1 methyltransferase domain-containing protein [Pontixanthobacter aestiaquae]
MEVTEVSYRIIADLLEARTGQQLTEGRRWRIGTALSGIFRERGITNIDQLVCLLADNSNGLLAQDVVEALLNNETYFYRDRIMFELLSQRVLPDLAAKRAETKRLSIWSAGCSTGQEALTLAMLFADNPSLWKGWTIDIVGTDISQKAINAAQRGCYTQFEIQRGLGVTQMLRHFNETQRGWEPSADLRKMVRFKQRNILEPAGNIQRFDLVLCRNVLLYFDTARRSLAFDRIAEAMRDDGWLMIGAGETAVGRTELFQSVERHQGLYQRAPASLMSETGENGAYPARRKHAG